MGVRYHTQKGNKTVSRQLSQGKKARERKREREKFKNKLPFPSITDSPEVDKKIRALSKAHVCLCFDHVSTHVEKKKEKDEMCDWLHQKQGDGSSNTWQKTGRRDGSLCLLLTNRGVSHFRAFYTTVDEKKKKRVHLSSNGLRKTCTFLWQLCEHRVLTAPVWTERGIRHSWQGKKKQPTLYIASGGIYNKSKKTGHGRVGQAR